MKNSATQAFLHDNEELCNTSFFTHDNEKFCIAHSLITTERILQHDNEEF